MFMESISIRLPVFKRPIPARQIVIVLAIAFFFLASWQSWGHPLKFDSPDETAAYFFARRLANGQGLSIEQPFHEVTSIILPRGFSLVESNRLAPATFLGQIVLYGVISRFSHQALILFLTPLLSAVALVAFFLALKKVFSEQIAMLSTVLLALHPSFWYYSSRGMYHNALFFDLLVLGCWSLATAVGSVTADRRRSWWYVLTGALFGLAIAVRPAEAAWVSLAVLGLIVVLRRQIDFRVGWWVGLLAFLIPLIGLFLLNGSVYGQPSSFGYEETAADVDGGSGLTLLWDRARFLFFPFGVHGPTALQNFWHYGVSLVWWLSIPTILGVIQAWRSSVARTYTFFAAAITVWLVLSYGSWVFFDNPDPTKVTLGTSYMRYWLPMFALGLPYAAGALFRFAGWLQRWRVGSQPVAAEAPGMGFGVGAVLVVALFFSSSIVLFDRAEGLATTRRHAIEYRSFANHVAEATPEQSVIITGQADKIFSPERPVIVAVDGSERIVEVRKLTEVTPVYVFVAAVEAPSVVKRIWEDRGFSIGDEIELSAGVRLIQLRAAPAT